jgi:hypothetical protein
MDIRPFTISVPEEHPRALSAELRATFRSLR